MDYKTETLVDIPSYEKIDKGIGSLFYESLLEELCFHYDNNDKYQKFCQIKNFNPHHFNGEIKDIPPIHVSVFKALGKELASVPSDTIKFTLQSSATSGVPSSILVDKITTKRQSKAMVRVVSNFIGNERSPFLIMDVDPTSGFKNILGARFAAVSGYLKFASKVEYFLKINSENKYYFDVDGIKRYIEELDESKPAIVFGFTYILYSEVVKPLIEKGVSFKLPKGSKIIHIGGWKKLEDEKIDESIFNLTVSKLFGIEASDVIDIYGFTEQMGLNYPSCCCGFKHAPTYSDVIVRDIETKEVLPPGVPGLLEFVSPIPHSYPGNVVLTDDIGVIENSVNSCNRSGTRFKVLGRLKKAEIRGCGDILSNKLTFSHNSKTSLNLQSNGSSFKIEYFLEKGLIESSLNSKDKLLSLISSVRDKIDWLRAQPIDALIGLIDKAVKKWTNDLSLDMPNLKSNGLGFLSNWCRAEHLNSIMTEGLQGNRLHIDAFIPISSGNSVQLRKAISKGLACHWLAGNVQVLGMFVLIQSILTKNVNILKVSSRDNGVFSSLLRAFENLSFETKGGYKIFGNDLLKTIAVVYFNHSEDDLGQMMSLNSDIRIAWGGAEAISSVTNYSKKYDCEDIIMGPKISFSVISKDSLTDEHSAKKIARKVAVDASVFDQTGCASTHNVFVQKGGNISPFDFTKQLYVAMNKALMQIPKGPTSAEQIAAIHSIRGIYDFKGIVLGDNDTSCTVLYDEENKLCKPVYSRVVFVHAIDKLDDCLTHITDDIQTIGLSAESYAKMDFVLKASNKGALRFPVCGKMLNFDSPWDGMYLTNKMVKWVTVGGPLV